MGKPFLTLEDLKACFSLFCCVYGVGTLGMPGNYARAGAAYATVALLFMAAVNIYASVAISKVMLVAPKSVRTYGDLGEWAMGAWGRWLVVVSQMLVCTMVPCVFLVLGGTLLDVLFPDSFKPGVWIVFMGISLLPVCLIPTLKEGAFAAAAGCLGTVTADIIGLSVLVYNMTPKSLSTPAAHLTFKGVTSVFGNLSLAYGAGIVIPALQREHSDPTRMPRVVFVTLSLISVFFLTLAITGWSVVGCQIPGNLLFAIAGTKLGWSADRGAVVMAFLFMQLHITIAFSVILFPAMYTLERLVLGLHKRDANDDDNKVYQDAATPGEVDESVADVTKLRTSSIKSIVSVAEIECVNEEADINEYNAPGVYVKVALLRIILVALCVLVSVLLKDRFLDLQDFVGASSMSLCCMILPVVFYLKVFYTKMGFPEKAFAVIVILVVCFLGVYVSYTTGKTLFAPEDPDPAILFPYCPPEYQNMVYTNTTFYQS